MSLYANPLMYLNLGGEMLYVLRQRLKAQRIRYDKTIKVLDDVTVGLLDPNNLKIVTQKTQMLNLSWMRSTMEKIALCSIMKLDNDSMDKLFDLMTMMVKYQFTAATGPREIILITLNHIDSLREIISSSNAHQHVTSIHQMTIDFYGKLTYNEIWEARNECLRELESINVRVSILLRLGIQNEDTTFNLIAHNYDEKFNEQQSELGELKLLENTCSGFNLGSFQLFGDRVTPLGRNIYAPNYINSVAVVKQPPKNREEVKDCGMTAELGMLAMQLGTDEVTSFISRPFSLDLFIDDVELNPNIDDTPKSSETSTEQENMKLKCLQEQKSNDDYREKLNSVCADFIENDTVDQKMNLLQLLDEAE